MALRSSASLLRSCVSRLRTGSGDVHGHQPSFKLWPVRAEFTPVYVALGLITLSSGFGMYTAMHHIKWAPNVRLKKSRRESIPEVVKPEKVVDETDHFIKNSFFRKVAHVQDSDRQEVMPNPISGDVYEWKNRVRTETLKDVGVEPPKDPGNRQ